MLAEVPAHEVGDLERQVRCHGRLPFRFLETALGFINALITNQCEEGLKLADDIDTFFNSLGHAEGLEDSQMIKRD